MTPRCQGKANVVVVMIHSVIKINGKAQACFSLFTQGQREAEAASIQLLHRTRLVTYSFNES